MGHIAGSRVMYLWDIQQGVGSCTYGTYSQGVGSCTYVTYSREKGHVPMGRTARE